MGNSQMECHRQAFLLMSVSGMTPNLDLSWPFLQGLPQAFLHFKINLDQFASPFLCIQPRNTYKNWELEAVWLNICSVWMHLFCFLSQNLGPLKYSVFFPYQSHHFLCSFLGFLFWDISTLAHAVQKQLQINTSMQPHRFVLLGNRMLKFESFLQPSQRPKKRINILQSFLNWGPLKLVDHSISAPHFCSWSWLGNGIPGFRCMPSSCQHQPIYRYRQKSPKVFFRKWFPMPTGTCLQHSTNWPAPTPRTTLKETSESRNMDGLHDGMKWIEHFCGGGSWFFLKLRQQKPWYVYLYIYIICTKV